MVIVLAIGVYCLMLYLLLRSDSDLVVNSQDWDLPDERIHIVPFTLGKDGIPEFKPQLLYKLKIMITFLQVNLILLPSC
jgi:hypothetical protein